jgi:hypothetical protein
MTLQEIERDFYLWVDNCYGFSVPVSQWHRKLTGPTVFAQVLQLNRTHGVYRVSPVAKDDHETVSCNESPWIKLET